MSTFVPVYRPKPSQQTFLERERKRKRNRESEGAPASPESLSDIRDARPANPISLKDPFYVAGHPRGLPLPGGNFPHAPVPDAKPFDVSVDEELAQVKPPIYVPDAAPNKHPVASRRRHIDNLTALLHRCMSEGDWKRASRIWGLLIRTELDGSAMDVRRHGRWGIGAELLMRCNQESPGESATHEGAPSALAPAITDRGFKLARDYYERLILQYPHRPTTRGSVNALVIYPALFNIWIYEVQDRSRRASERLEPASGSTSAEVLGGDQMVDSVEVHEIRTRELEEAQPILQRLDDLLSAPPYDKDPTLLQYRGFVGLWVSDLHLELAESYSLIPKSEDLEDSSLAYASEDDDQPVVRQHRSQARDEQIGARKVFERMKMLEMRLSDDIVRFLNESEDTKIRRDSSEVAD